MSRWGEDYYDYYPQGGLSADSSRSVLFTYIYIYIYMCVIIFAYMDIPKQQLST